MRSARAAAARGTGDERHSRHARYDASPVRAAMEARRSPAAEPTIGRHRGVHRFCTPAEGNYAARPSGHGRYRRTRQAVGVGEWCEVEGAGFGGRPRMPVSLSLRGRPGGSANSVGRRRGAESPIAGPGCRAGRALLLAARLLPVKVAGRSVCADASDRHGVGVLSRGAGCCASSRSPGCASDRS